MARNQIASRFDERFEALKQSMRHLVEAGNDIKDKMMDVKDTAVSGTKSGINRLGGLIKDHPIAAVAIAFGIGFVAIKMIRR